MKNTISKMKNTLKGISSRIHKVLGQISDSEGKVTENTQAEDQKEI